METKKNDWDLPPCIQKGSVVSEEPVVGTLIKEVALSS
jgi:hypothetical protein